MELTSQTVKEIMTSLGADLCGIAGIDRFDDAPQAAGLGTIGRHSLLITPEFGSMVWLGAVLCEQEFEADALIENICNNCNLCVEACPVDALKEPELNQQNCWDYAFGDDEDLQSWVISCHKCRDVCPYNLGSERDMVSK